MLLAAKKRNGMGIAEAKAIPDHYDQPPRHCARHVALSLGMLQYANQGHKTESADKKYEFSSEKCFDYEHVLGGEDGGEDSS